MLESTNLSPGKLKFVVPQSASFLSHRSMELDKTSLVFHMEACKDVRVSDREVT